MNDERSFERFVADNVAGTSQGIPLPDDFYDDMHSFATTTGQRPEWLALIKEPPMRTNSHVAVGSPTVRVAAIVAATLLLAVALATAGIAGQRLLAADAIVVDQSGNGDHTTITAAVEAASSGDTILVKPGRYNESVAIIGKDLTVVGDGDRADVVIEAATSEYPSSVDLTAVLPADEQDGLLAWGFLFADTETTVSGLTVLGDPKGAAILVLGAQADATLEEVATRSLGDIAGDFNAIAWEDGSSGTLRNSVVEGWVRAGEDVSVVIEGNQLPATCVGAWNEGADLVIRGNVIHGCPYEKGLDIDARNTALIEGNDIWVEDVDVDPEVISYSGGRIGVEVFGDGPGTVTILDNDIHDSRFGIQVTSGSPALQIAGNRLRDNDMGISRIAGPITIQDNSITGSRQIGLELRDGAATVEGNTITGNTVGLSLQEGSTPVLRGNTVCDNTTNIRLPSDSGQFDVADNEICPDDATA